MAGTTLRDIARRANVSVASVSKALSGSAEISEPTRLRIEKITRQLNYVPRRRVDRKREVLRRVALCLCVSPQDTFGPNRVTELIATEGMKQQIGIELICMDQQRMVKQPAHSVEALKSVDGVILHGHVLRSTLQWLAESQIPCVVIGLIAGDVSELLPYGVQVATDTVAMGQVATRKLINDGHKRIFFSCTGAPEGLYFDQWLVGYRRAHEQAGIKVDPKLIQFFGAEHRPQVGAITAEAVIKMRNPPTGFILPETRIAETFVASMRLASREIKHDDVITGGFAHDQAKYADVNVPNICEDLAELSRTAYRILSRQASGEPFPQGIRVFVPYRASF